MKEILVTSADEVLGKKKKKCPLDDRHSFRVDGRKKTIKKKKKKLHLKSILKKFNDYARKKKRNG